VNRQNLIPFLKKLWPFLFILILSILGVLFLRKPPKLCEATAFQISLQIGTQPFETIDFPIQKSIEVNGAEPIVIRADIKTGPNNCVGSPHIAWSLLSDNALSQAKIFGTPTSEYFEIILNTSMAEAVVSIEIKNAAGELQERVFMPFSINGDSQ